MNRFLVKVKKIESVKNLNIVEFIFYNQTLKMMSLDLRDDLLVGSEVELVVKPTHVVIAKEFSGEISCSNILQAKILEVDNGELLSTIRVNVEDYVIDSIITRESSIKMNLKKDDNVTIFIKSSDISIRG